MKKSELFSLAASAVHETFANNQDVIDSRIRELIISKDKSEQLSYEDSIAVAISTAILLAPEISATATAKMLIDLGLVEVEEDE